MSQDNIDKLYNLYNLNQDISDMKNDLSEKDQIYLDSKNLSEHLRSQIDLIREEIISKARSEALMATADLSKKLKELENITYSYEKQRSILRDLTEKNRDFPFKPGQKLKISPCYSHRCDCDDFFPPMEVFLVGVYFRESFYFLKTELECIITEIKNPSGRFTLLNTVTISPCKSQDIEILSLT